MRAKEAEHGIGRSASLRAMSPTVDAILLGRGYTATLVAQRLVARGVRVLASTRRPASGLAGVEALRLDASDPGTVAALGERASRLAPGYAVLCSVPPGPEQDRDPVAPLLAALPGAGRIVYLSTTSVYGDALEIDERTPPAPRTPADRLRLAAEAAVLGGPWPGLVLRPAAIYGPGRGLHVLLREGRLPPLDPDKPGSRIHVDDLAALCDAALEARITGAFPVADDEPATPREVAALCAALGLPAARFEPGVARHGARRVDGRAIRRALGVTLRFPSYRQGIRAALAAERAAP